MKLFRAGFIGLLTLGARVGSRAFYAALQDHEVPAHYVELPSGGHGLNGYQGPMWDAWLAKSIQWMVEHDFITAKRQVTG